jgi:hypothetical protein
MRIVDTYSWNNYESIYGLFRFLRITSTPNRNPRNLSSLSTVPLSREHTINGVMYSPAVEMHPTMEMCFKFRCTLWNIVCPATANGTITFVSTLSSHLLLSTSSKLNTSFAHALWTWFQNRSTAASRKTRGTSSLGFARGTLFVCRNGAGDKNPPILAWYPFQISECIHATARSCSLLYCLLLFLLSNQRVPARSRSLTLDVARPLGKFHNREVSWASLPSGQFRSYVQLICLTMRFAGLLSQIR